ncbi:MAG: hypothetical protein AAF797_09635 [Planctomycetota bacterium]
MIPDVTTTPHQTPGPAYALLDVPVPLDHARSLLGEAYGPVVEPLRRGPWGVITLALRWPTTDDEKPTPARSITWQQPVEVWAAGVRARIMTHQLDVLDTHAPIHLAPPSPHIRLLDAKPGQKRVFPLLDTAHRELLPPASVVTIDKETGRHQLHQLRFEPATPDAVPEDTFLQRVAFTDEQGGLAWLRPKTGTAPAEAWLRWLGPGAWQGESGQTIDLLQSGSLGGSLWGADQDRLRIDPQPLVPPIAQIPLSPPKQPAATPDTARVFAAS